VRNGKHPAHAAPHQLVRARGTLVLLAGAAALAVALARFAVHVETFAFTARMFDLGIYRDGGLIVRHTYHFRSGRSTPLYDWVSPGGGNPFTYPPFAAGIFALMSYLPLPALQWGMTAASLAALVTAVWLTIGAVDGPSGRARAGLALAVSALALWTQPVQSNLALGQINLLLMVAIIWDLRPSAKGALGAPGRTVDRWWTGAATGIAAGIKLTPLIFIPYLLVTRRFRAAATAAVTFAATVAIAFLPLPGASAMYWGGGLFARANGSSTANLEFYFASSWNQSLRGLLSRLMLHADLATGPWLMAALVTAVAGLLCAAWLHNDGYPMLGVLACALTGLLISPISWLHHWVWVAAWLAATFAMALRARGAARWAWLGITALVTLAFVDLPRLPLLRVGGQGLDLVTNVPRKHPLAWHGLEIIGGNIFVLAGLAGLAALFGWGIVRAFQPARTVAANPLTAGPLTAGSHTAGPLTTGSHTADPLTTGPLTASSPAAPGAAEPSEFWRGDSGPEVMTYRGD